MRKKKNEASELAVTLNGEPITGLSALTIEHPPGYHIDGKPLSQKRMKENARKALPIIYLQRDFGDGIDRLMKEIIKSMIGTSWMDMSYLGASKKVKVLSITMTGFEEGFVTIIKLMQKPDWR